MNHTKYELTFQCRVYIYLVLIFVFISDSHLFVCHDLGPVAGGSGQHKRQPGQYCSAGETGRRRTETQEAHKH